MQQTIEGRKAEVMACYASNILQQTVQFKRLEVAGGVFIRFYLFRNDEAASTWPAEIVREADEAKLGRAIADSLLLCH